MNCYVEFFQFSDYPYSSISTRFSDFSDSPSSTRFSSFSYNTILPIFPTLRVLRDSTIFPIIRFFRFFLFSEFYAILRFFPIIRFFRFFRFSEYYAILRFVRLYDSSDFSDSPSSMRFSYFSDYTILPIFLLWPRWGISNEWVILLWIIAESVRRNHPVGKYSGNC